MEKEFYVGYLPEAPEGLSKRIKKITTYVLIVVVSASIIFSISQEQFPGITFEYGTFTELTGYVTETPFPTLHVLSEDEQASKSILLVNFGKFGAQKLIQNWSQKNGSLEGKKVTLKGTLIYYDGVSLLELSEEEASLVSIKDSDFKFISPPTTIAGNSKIKGEILDAKCFFGVMNPGHGKTHKSCAVRCISGGIPPIFGASLNDNQTFYGVVIGPDSKPVNQHLLSVVGKTTELEGTIMKIGDMNYFQLNDVTMSYLDKLEYPLLDIELAFCQKSLLTSK